MIYDFFGHRIVVNKIQVVMPPVYNWYFGANRHFSLFILFYGEQDYKRVLVPLIENEEYIVNVNGGANIFLLDNGIVDGPTHIEKTIAGIRILPIYNGLIKAMELCAESQE